MSNVIVKYHNDFNKIQLPSLTELEQNILFAILSKIRDKKQENNKPIRLFAKDIVMGKVESKEYFTAVIDSLKTKFFKASFRQIIKTKTGIIDSHFHFFNTMDIHYEKENPDDEYDNSKVFCYIDLAINERFEYLLNELTANFTHFELVEFVSLSGKYTKTLYRLLKQFRNTGKLKMQWQEFLYVMDIPKNYEMCNIEQRVLKPALRELTKPRNLFDMQRVPFKNLKYTKIKSGGNKVTGIELSFTPEIQELENLQEQELKQKDQIINQQAQELVFKKEENLALKESNQNLMQQLGLGDKYTQYKYKSYTNANNETLKIVGITENFNKEIVVQLKNMETDKLLPTKTFPSENHLKKYLSTLTEN